MRLPEKLVARLKECARQYRANLLESVIPFWLAHSLDGECGGYFTCLGRDGTVYDPRKYVWLQGRQVWMFSRLYNELERRREWLDAATLGMEFLLRHGRDPQGRYYFRLERDGRPSFYQRKPYAAVFAMLAMLEYSKTGAGPRYLDEAVRLFSKIREWIEDPALLGAPALEGRPAPSRLADVMVTASMALELSRVHDDPRYLRVMRECLDRALLHHDPERNILLENVGADGARILDLPEGRLFSPGHSVETAWFLLRLADRLNDRSVETRILDIIEGSLAFGWDAEYGGLYYFMDIEGKPPLQLEAGMKLWWPHTEALFAVILAATRTGEPRWIEWLEHLHNYTVRHFVDTSYGEWFGYCDRQGKLTQTLKGNNYKGCFHVPRFLLMSIQKIESSLANADTGRKG